MNLRQADVILPDRSRSKVEVVGRILAVVAIVIWVVACGFEKEIYNAAKGSLDDSGWIEHSHDTPIWIGGDWMVGEYRVCQMPVMWNLTLPHSIHLICGQDFKPDLEQPWPPDFQNSISSHDLYELIDGHWDAVDHVFHVLPVKYWGRIDRKRTEDQVTFAWRCQREANELECKAIN